MKIILILLILCCLWWLLFFRDKNRVIILILLPILIWWGYISIQWKEGIYKILSYWIQTFESPVEKIDTSFFDDEVKNSLLNIATELNDKNLASVTMDSEEIIYYDFDRNVLTQKNLLWLEIIKELNEKNIKHFSISINAESVLSKVDIYFSNKKYNYIYKAGGHNYTEWYIIPVMSWRIEKVIDDYWYIWRICDRNICQEPQW